MGAKMGRGERSHFAVGQLMQTGWSTAVRIPAAITVSSSSGKWDWKWVGVGWTRLHPSQIICMWGRKVAITAGNQEQAWATHPAVWSGHRDPAPALPRAVIRPHAELLPLSLEPHMLGEAGSSVILTGPSGGSEGTSLANRCKWNHLGPTQPRTDKAFRKKCSFNNKVIKIVILKAFPHPKAVCRKILAKDSINWGFTVYITDVI